MALDNLVYSFARNYKKLDSASLRAARWKVQIQGQALRFSSALIVVG